MKRAGRVYFSLPLRNPNKRNANAHTRVMGMHTRSHESKKSTKLLMITGNTPVIPHSLFPDSSDNSRSVDINGGYRVIHARG